MAKRKLTVRETSTILVALRLFQDQPTHVSFYLPDYFPTKGAKAPLTDKQIDKLCERLNCEDVTIG